MELGLTYYLIVFAVVLILLGTQLLSKKLHYFVSGINLIVLGLLPILNHFEIIHIDLEQMPILKFVAAFFLGFATKDLFVEAIKEKESKWKYPTLIITFILVILITIPGLYSMDVIEFNLDLPLIVNSLIYFIAGILMFIGVFTLLQTDESK
jgi:uncharacterized integral membrane protein